MSTFAPDSKENTLIPAIPIFPATTEFLYKLMLGFRIVAGNLPDSIQRKLVVSQGTTQSNQRITFDNVNSFLLIMMHVTDASRTPSVAIAQRDSTGVYALYEILKTNTGDGFYVSSDGTYIVASGLASQKRIVAIHLTGSKIDSFNFSS